MQQQSNNSIDRSISREVQTGIIPRTRRRGSLVEVQTDETPTERFVGLPEEEVSLLRRRSSVTFGLRGGGMRIIKDNLIIA